MEYIYKTIVDGSETWIDWETTDKKHKDNSNNAIVEVLLNPETCDTTENTYYIFVADNTSINLCSTYMNAFKLMVSDGLKHVFHHVCYDNKRPFNVISASKNIQKIIDKHTIILTCNSLSNKDLNRTRHQTNITIIDDLNNFIYDIIKSGHIPIFDIEINIDNMYYC